MNPPPQLPFPIEAAYDYIITAEDRERFKPKQEGDEFWWSEVGQWKMVCYADSKFSRNVHYRRRKPASGWVRVTKESLPEAGKPFWVTISDFVGLFRSGVSNVSTVYMAGYTHFRYCEGSYQIPPPPEPEREAWEVAFEAADKEAQSKAVGPTADCWAFTAGERKASFKAGWDAKAKEGK